MLSMRNFIKRIERLIKSQVSDLSNIYVSDRIIRIARKYVSLKAKEYTVKQGDLHDLHWSAEWCPLGVPESYFDTQLTFHTTNFGNELVVVHVWVIASEVLDSRLNSVDLSGELVRRVSDISDGVDDL